MRSETPFMGSPSTTTPLSYTSSEDLSVITVLDAVQVTVWIRS